MTLETVAFLLGILVGMALMIVIFSIIERILK